MKKSLLYVAGGINIFLGGIGILGTILAIMLVRIPVFWPVSLVISLVTGGIFLHAAYKQDTSPASVKTNVLIASIASLLVCNIASFVLGIIAYSQNDAEPNYSVEKSTKKELTKEEKEAKKMKNLLRLGTALIIISGIIFATSTWATLSGIVKTCILIASSLLFWGLSFLADKKLNIKASSITYYILGNAFAIVSLISAGYFEVFGEWFSFNGTGINLFVTFIWVLIGGLAYLAYLKYNKNQFLYVVVFSLISAIWCGLLFAKVSVDITFIIISAFVSIGTIIKGNGNKYLNIINRFSIAFLAVMMCSVLIRSTGAFAVNSIFNIISFAIVAVASYYLALVNKNSFYRAFAPILVTSIAIVITAMGNAELKVTYLQLLIISTVLYAVGYAKKSDKLFYNTSSVMCNFAFFYVVIDALEFNYNYFAIVAALAMLATSLIVTINKEFGKYHFERVLEPLKVLILSYVIYRLFDTFDIAGNCIFALAVSIVFLIMCFVKKDFLKFIYFVGTCLAIFIAYVANLGQYVPIIQVVTVAVLGMLMSFACFEKDKKYSNCKEIIYSILLLAIFTASNSLITKVELHPLSYLVIVLIYAIMVMLVRNNNRMRYITLLALFMPYYSALYDSNLPHIGEFVFERIPFAIMVFIYTRGFLKSANEKLVNVLEIVGMSAWYISILTLISPKIALFVGIVAFVSILIGYKSDKYSSLYYTGILFTILNILIQLKDIWRIIPVWAYILCAGLILIGIVAYKEYESNRKIKTRANDVIEHNDAIQNKVVDKRTILVGTVVYAFIILSIIIKII